MENDAQRIEEGPLSASAIESAIEFDRKIVNESTPEQMHAGLWLIAHDIIDGYKRGLFTEETEEALWEAFGKLQVKQLAACIKKILPLGEGFDDLDGAGMWDTIGWDNGSLTAILALSACLYCGYEIAENLRKADGAPMSDPIAETGKPRRGTLRTLEELLADCKEFLEDLPPTSAQMDARNALHIAAYMLAVLATEKH